MEDNNTTLERVEIKFKVQQLLYCLKLQKQLRERVTQHIETKEIHRPLLADSLL